jgi:hypothetical protein
VIHAAFLWAVYAHLTTLITGGIVMGTLYLWERYKAIAVRKKQCFLRVGSNKITRRFTQLLPSNLNESVGSQSYILRPAVQMRQSLFGSHPVHNKSIPKFPQSCFALFAQDQPLFANCWSRSSKKAVASVIARKNVTRKCGKSIR